MKLLLFTILLCLPGLCFAQYIPPSSLGTANTLAKFTATSTLGNSRITDSTNIAVNSGANKTDIGDTAGAHHQTLVTVDDATNSVAIQFPDAGFFNAANVSGDLSFRMDGPGKSITLVADNGIVLADPIQGAFSVNSGSVHVSSNTITGTDPALDAAQTWNSGGSTFVGIKLNITDTASAAGSLLEDLQVGGVTKYNVSKAGTLTAAGNAVFTGTVSASAVLAGGSIPSISSGTIGTGSKNEAGFFTSTTTGVYTGTLTFNGVTAPTGWSCGVSNQTTANLFRQTGGSATTAVFGGTTVSGDKISYICSAY